MRKLLIGLIFLATGYSAAWFYGMHRIEDFTAGKISGLHDAGYVFSYENIEKGGFPFKARIKFVRPVARYKDIFEVRTPGDITVETYVWRPFQIAAKVDEPTFFILGGQNLNIGRGSIEKVQAVYRQKNHSVDLSHVRIQKGPLTNAQIGTISYQSTHKAYPDVSIAFYDVDARVLQNNPIGTQIQELSLALKKQGDMQGNSWYEALKSWSENQGHLDIKTFRLKWGQLDIKGNGEVALDATLQPVANVKIQIQGADKTIDTLIENNMIDPTLAGMLKMGASLLTAPANDGDEPKPLAFHLKKGQLYMGTVPLVNIGHLPIVAPPPPAGLNSSDEENEYGQHKAE